MYIKYEKKNKYRARNLRKNMTEAERKLWYVYLRKHKERFLRQKTIDNYIVDFYCPTKKLVIELDGGQHYSDEGERYDNIRSEILERYGLKILRFTNIEINKYFKGVCEAIENAILKPSVAKATAPLNKGAKVDK